MFTKAFWKGAAERAIKTFAQTLAGFLVVGEFAGIDFSVGLQAAAVAAGLSLLTSIASPDFVAGKPGAELTDDERAFVDDIRDREGRPPVA